MTVTALESALRTIGALQAEVERLRREADALKGALAAERERRELAEAAEANRIGLLR